MNMEMKIEIKGRKLKMNMKRRLLMFFRKKVMMIATQSVKWQRKVTSKRKRLFRKKVRV